MQRYLTHFKQFYLARLPRRTMHILLLVLLFQSFFILTSDAAPPPVAVHVDYNTPINTSAFSPGITHVDNTLTPYGNDATAVSNVKSLIRGAIPYEATSIMAWGIDDPWPDPSQPEPTNWATLDSRIQLIQQTGGIPVLTLAEAPWWMKGQLQADGTTRQLTQADEWSGIAYSSRILDNKMSAWVHLVQRVAERYMAPPYNVRYFQVWNELKGYYNPSTNNYDYTNSPGDPSGPYAEHGYTYMYNQVYQKLMDVAHELHVSQTSVKVGGPYVVMDTWSTTHQSNPSSITKAYGTFDQRPLDVIQYWLQHKIGAGFITLDGGNNNKDNINLADPFTASEKFADVTDWVRSLDNTIYPGATTLPVWWAEWYAAPYTDTANNSYNNAVKTYAMIELLKVGGAVPFSWGGTGEGTQSSGLWTTTSMGVWTSTRGQALPWYYSYKDFRNDFPAGTLLYNTTISVPSSVAALASSNMLMLVNKTASNVAVDADGTLLTLTPYQVIVLNQHNQVAPKRCTAYSSSQICPRRVLPHIGYRMSR